MEYIAAIGLVVNFALAVFTLWYVFLTKYSIGKTADILTETQREFELSNRPYLQASAFKLEFIDSIKAIKFSDSLTNIGKESAKADSVQFIWGYASGLTTYTSFKPLNDTATTIFKPSPVYLPAQQPQETAVMGKYADTIYDKIRKGKMFATVYLDFRYRGLSTEKPRVYRILYEINYDTISKSIKNHPIYNENFDLDSLKTK